MFVPDVKYLAFREDSREEGRKLTVRIHEINQGMPTVLLFFPRKGTVLLWDSATLIVDSQRFVEVNPVASTAVSR